MHNHFGEPERGLTSNTRGVVMQNTIEITRLSRKEKLRIMEAIWENLSTDPEQVESPDWHRHALEDTERRVSSGQEKTMDWSEAKNELRNRFE